MSKRYSIVVGLLVFSLTSAACSRNNPLAPSAPASTPDVQYVHYDIHIPDASMVAALKIIYTIGVNTSPEYAQVVYDYRKDYGGPNVFATGTCAPVAGPVSNVAAFYGERWPNSGLQPGTVYKWEGQFIYTPADQMRC